MSTSYNSDSNTEHVPPTTYEPPTVVFTIRGQDKKSQPTNDVSKQKTNYVATSFDSWGTPYEQAPYFAAQEFARRATSRFNKKPEKTTYMNVAEAADTEYMKVQRDGAEDRFEWRAGDFSSRNGTPARRVASAAKALRML